MRRVLTAVVCAVACLTAAAPAWAGGEGMMIGAAEDAANQVDPLAAKAKMDLARFAGFDTIRVTALWQPGDQTLENYDLVTLGNAAAAARLDGIRLVVSVYPTGSRSTPLSFADQTEFAGFAAELAAALRASATSSW